MDFFTEFAAVLRKDLELITADIDKHTTQSVQDELNRGPIGPRLAAAAQIATMRSAKANIVHALTVIGYPITKPIAPPAVEVLSDTKETK